MRWPLEKRTSHGRRKGARGHWSDSSVQTVVDPFGGSTSWVTTAVLLGKISIIRCSPSMVRRQRNAFADVDAPDLTAFLTWIPFSLWHLGEDIQLHWLPIPAPSRASSVPSAYRSKPSGRRRLTSPRICALLLRQAGLRPDPALIPAPRSPGMKRVKWIAPSLDDNSARLAILGLFCLPSSRMTSGLETSNRRAHDGCWPVWRTLRSSRSSCAIRSCTVLGQSWFLSSIIPLSYGSTNGNAA